MHRTVFQMMMKKMMINSKDFSVNFIRGVWGLGLDRKSVV